MQDVAKRREFLVSECVGTSNEVLVKGVCNLGVITLGDVFTGLIREAENGLQETIELRVVGITAYRREIDELPQGMSAELRCMGTLKRELAINDLLIG